MGRRDRPRARLLGSSLALALATATATLACGGAAPRAQDEDVPEDIRNPTLTLTLAGGESRALTLAEMAATIAGGPTTLEVDNPAYKRAITYRGYWLADVLAAAGVSLDGAGELIFHCADGYAATLPVERFAEASPFLAIGQVGEDGELGWEKVRIGKEYLSPAPFYVVGKDPASYAWFGWPLQVTAIEAMGRRSADASANPEGAPEDGEVARGFALFKGSCLACHSVNLQGGSVGPELNTPRNITEYRDRPTLRAFIRDPASFRARSKMPPFPLLGDEDLDAILAYLTYMRGHKRSVDR
ncbi:MAG: c-type cytochrome [Myxococcales bacterium]|nr:c-type cytochrome [Myxococcales bacterium]MCB9704889.1 c-type cytochrome [Myxococcales bacterium]